MQQVFRPRWTIPVTVGMLYCCHLRDAQLSTAASQQEALVRSIKAEAEQRVSSMTQEYEARLAGGCLEVALEYRAQVWDATTSSQNVPFAHRRSR